MLSLGVTKGDRVALLCENRLEWLYTDMGSLGIGGCLVPIYTTLSPAEVHYILEDSGAKLLVVEDEALLEKALKVAKDAPDLEAVVLIDGDPPRQSIPRVISFARMLELGARKQTDSPSLFEDIAASVGPEDLATLVYTSGTTGAPKGAMITHGNIMAVINALDQVKPPYADDRDRTVPFLPLSHVFERVAGHFYGMFLGVTASYAGSIETVLADVQEKKPTIILAVPRVCEKIYQKILDEVKKQPTWKQKIFYWGHRAGATISEHREKKRDVSFTLKLKYRLAYALVFKKLREALGGRVRWITASGAPTSREIILFFNAAGIMVIEGYGMTECCAPATMSNLADYRIGTVGCPLPGVEIRLDHDGEILIKGENVFQGYWHREQETQEAFTPDGFFRSGDIGAFTEEGFLEILDRKKDLIITSGGKNVAPQKIENLFKSDPLFSQFVVIGEGRKFLSALVNINTEEAARIAMQESIPFDEPRELLASEAFLVVVDHHVALLNEQLARYETIKRYAVIEHTFSMETGELTATLKVKRKVIREKYRDLIDAMYREEKHGPRPFREAVKQGRRKADED